MELEQYGTLRHLRINRGPPQDPDLAELVGTQPQDVWQPGQCGFVYAEYESPAQAEQAQKVLAGRKFNGRTVVTMIQPVDL